MKINAPVTVKIEYSVKFESQGELDVLLNYARETGLGDLKTDDRVLVKRLFQKEGEKVRCQK